MSGRPVGGWPSLTVREPSRGDVGLEKLHGGEFAQDSQQPAQYAVKKKGRRDGSRSKKACIAFRVGDQTEGPAGNAASWTIRAVNARR